MKSRLKKIALMPIQTFQSQLDQISDKGRDLLKAIEEYKFFVEQTSRVMKNDPALTEIIVSKKKNLEEASQKIYDIVFDIENLDISALYERQQEVINEENKGDSNTNQQKQNINQEKEKIDDKSPNPNKNQKQNLKPNPTKPQPQKEEINNKQEPKEEDKKDTKKE